MSSVSSSVSLTCHPCAFKSPLTLLLIMPSSLRCVYGINMISSKRGQANITKTSITIVFTAQVGKAASQNGELLPDNDNERCVHLFCPACCSGYWTLVSYAVTTLRSLTLISPNTFQRPQSLIQTIFRSVQLNINSPGALSCEVVSLFLFTYRYSTCVQKGFRYDLRFSLDTQVRRTQGEDQNKRRERKISAPMRLPPCSQRK